MKAENNFVKETLPNGLRVITVPMPSARSVTVMMLVAAGSRYEEKKHNGLSHFMEHMFFKGAKRYPDAMAVASAIDGVGGAFNAFTGEERVGYFVKLSAGKMRIAYDVLSDMLLNSKFDEKEIDRERGVIIEEIRMYNDDPMSRAQMDFKEHFYGDQPLGWDIAGPEEVIQRVRREDFLGYRDHFYTAGNCVLVVAGGITHEENLKLASEFFTFGAGGVKPVSAPFKPIAPPTRSFLRKKEIEQAHIVMGFPIPGDDHEDQPALKLVNNSLGGTMSSRLFHQIRERRGLAYYIRSGRHAYTDTGALKISTGVNLKKAEEAIACIMDEVRKLSAEGITQDELSRAKENINGRSDLSLEDSMSVASLYATHETLHRKVKTPEEYAAEIEAVTLEMANEAVARYFDTSRIKLTILGPFESVEPFDRALGQ
ncbi:MAG: insulinase family protein [Nitrospinae bacterium]|nr:insulinase family protein [Nitrospinota bacterium]